MELTVADDVAELLGPAIVARARDLAAREPLPRCRTCDRRIPTGPASLVAEAIGPGLRVTFHHESCRPSSVVDNGTVSPSTGTDANAVAAITTQWPYAALIVDYEFGLFAPMGSRQAPAFMVMGTEGGLSVAAEWPPEHSVFSSRPTAAVNGSTLLLSHGSNPTRGDLFTGVLDRMPQFTGAASTGYALLTIGHGLAWNPSDEDGSVARLNSAAAASELVTAIIPLAVDGAPPVPLPGRNEPCLCGSGLKFKRCHAA